MVILSNLLFALDIQGIPWMKMLVHGEIERKPYFHPSILSCLWARAARVMPGGSLGATREQIAVAGALLGPPLQFPTHIFFILLTLYAVSFLSCAFIMPQKVGGFFLLFPFYFRRYSHDCHKSVIKWIDLWREVSKNTFYFDYYKAFDITSTYIHVGTLLFGWLDS